MHPVKVHNADRGDASRGEMLDDVHADTATPDYQDAESGDVGV